MEPDPPSLAAEGLLRDCAWVRELARWMIRDDHLADDLSQEVMIRAWQRSGGAGDAAVARNPRSWARAVMRNLARMHWRARERRERHEARCARPADVPSDEEVVRRAELQQRAVQAVLQLEEPYRTTVLLRFLEERSVKEVAERMGVPPSTVRVRCKRALERLQRGLIAECGDDPRAYLTGMSLLAGLPRAGRGAGAATTTTLVHGSSLMPKLALALLITVGAWSAVTLGAAFLRPQQKKPVLPASTAAAASELQDAGREPSASQERTARRTVAPVAPVAPVAKGQPHAAQSDEETPRGLGTLRGKVVDLRGAPVAGVSISVFPQALRAGEEPAFAPLRTLASAADGSFAATDLTGFVTHGLRFEKAGFVTHTSNDFAREISEVRLYRTGKLQGRVLTSDGVTPAEGVRLVLSAPRRHGIGRWSTASGGDGRFEVDGLPAGLDVTIEAFPGTGLPSEYEAPVAARGDSKCEIVLRERAFLEGVVVDFETGAGVPLARVLGGLRATEVATADAAGRFRLELDRHLLAAAPVDQTITLPGVGDLNGGWLGSSVCIRADGYVQTNAPLWRAAPELGLPFRVPLLRASTIAGRVSHADGRPAEGVLVGWEERPFRTLGAGAWAVTSRASSIQTAGDGSFELSDVPAGPTRSGVLAFRAVDGEAHFESDACPSEIGATRELDVVLGTQPVLSGRVFLNGQPAEAYVYVKTAGGSNERGVRTDSAGRFVVEGLAPGAIAVRACTADGSTVWSDSIQATFPPPSDEPLRVDILGEVRHVAGRITDTTGAPLEGVQVLAFPQRETGGMGHAIILAGFGTSDADGRFRLPLDEGAASSKVTLAVIFERSTFEQLDVEPGTETLEFVLPAFAPVELQLTSEGEAKPTSVTVRWRERLSGTSARLASGTPLPVSSTGRLSVMLPVGLVDLEVAEPSTGLSAALEEIPTASGAAPQELGVELRR